MTPREFDPIGDDDFREVAEAAPFDRSGLPPNGLHHVPLTTHRAWPAWGSSDLKAMRSGVPALVPWQRANPTPDTEDTKRGTAAHCLILQPDLFERSFAFKPAGMKFSTKEGIAWRDDPSRAGLSVIEAAEAQIVRDVAAAFDAKGIARESLDNAVAIERSMLWTDETTGEVCKGRPDWWTTEAVYDLKVSRHAHSGVALQAYTNGWMHQLAHYRAGLNALGHPVRKGRLVVIGPKPPQQFRVYCLEVKEAVLDVIAMENERTLAQLRDCRETNTWPGTPDEWKKVEAPPSALMSVVAAVDFGAAEEGDSNG